MTRVETICIVHQTPKVLLGLKKVRFGAGKYNGFGGGVKEGETLEQTVVREVQEEANITILNPKKIGRLYFVFANGEQDHDVHIYKATRYTGTPTETDEMKPEWFNENKIPYDKMWIDDPHWMPLFLADKEFNGRFFFDKSMNIDGFWIKEGPV